LPRSRKIEVDDVLDAAERVIGRLGLAGLSIDAVAKEAGISKSRVVYDHKSKSALMEALVARKLDAAREAVRATVADCANTPHPELFGRIAIAACPVNEQGRSIMRAIGAAASSGEPFQHKFRDRSEEDFRAISTGTDRPRAALMAYLALVGFYCTEVLDRQDWDDDERTRILNDIRSIFTSFPEPTSQPSIS